MLCKKHRKAICILSFNKTEVIIKTCKHVNYARIISILQTFMYQMAADDPIYNLDIEKNLQYIFASNKMLVIHK